MPGTKNNQKQLNGKKEENTKLPCCPELDKDKGCDYLDFHYRLLHSQKVMVEKKEYTIPVEVLIKARLQRCPGPMALGDPVYSTTLFPGEKVRLFTMDRRSKFSFDSESSLSYRHVQTSEERYYMASMSHFMSDLSTRENASATSQSSSRFSTGGETSGVLGTLFSGAEVDVYGVHTGSSTQTFLRELKYHAESAHNRSVQATRTSASVSIGEVQKRFHKEGESENHYESASRIFSNPNQCHSITYLFYQLAKTQTVRFEIVAIERRVVDTAAPTRVNTRPAAPTPKVSVVPDAILATNKNRIEIEELDRKSTAGLSFQRTVERTSAPYLPMTDTPMMVSARLTPIAERVREEVLKAVGDNLANVGLIDRKTYQLTQESRRQFSFEFHTSIPTPGLIVKGCMDKCDTCEPERQNEILLDLEHKKLENKLLQRQIDLFDKSQEYRCCPEDSEREEEEDGA